MDRRKQPDHKEILAAVAEYRRRGWHPTPLAGKNPAIGGVGWQERDHSDEEFAPGTNVGVILADGLVDVDLDAAEARLAAPHLVPHTDARFGRPSSPCAHWIYKTDETFITRQFSDPVITAETTTKRMLVELRAGNRTHQTMFPASVHPSTGEVLAWVDNGEPSIVPVKDLITAVSEVAAASLLGRYWPKGQRHSAALALAGGLANSGWLEDDVIRFIAAVCAAAKDEEVADRMRAVRDTFGKIGRSDNATGWPTLGKLLGDGSAIVEKVLEWLRREADPPEVRIREAAQPPVPRSELIVLWGHEVAEEPLVFVWKPYLPLGKLIHFGGASSQAKSPVTIDLAARISVGAPFPDGTPNHMGPKSVILLNIEDGFPDTILPRYRIAGGDKTKLCYVQGTRLNGNDPGSLVERGVALDRDFRLLANKARSITDLGLMVIDPITNYLGGLKMNDEGEVRSVLTPLAKLAAELNVVVITVGHFNRRERGTDPLHRIMGAAAFTGVARSVYAFGPDPEDKSKFAHVMTTVRGAVGEGPSLRYKTELISENRPDGPPLDIVKVVWTGTSDATAEDSVDPPSAQEKSHESAAADLLREIVRDGPKPAKECQAELNSEGFDPQKLNMCRVRRLADVVTKKLEGDRCYSWGIQGSFT